MTATVNVALLVLRIVAGLTIAAHGAQKFFGWFEGPGLNRWIQGMQKQGFKPPLLWTALVILGEFGGGLSLAFGFLTALGAAGVFGAMVMAILKQHWPNGFWNSKRGLEFPLQLLTIAVAIGLAGPGDYSLDHLFGIHLPSPWLFLILAAVALIVDLVGLVISRPSAAAPASANSTTTPQATS
jgi:putative oxidoreductase